MRQPGATVKSIENIQAFQHSDLFDAVFFADIPGVEWEYQDNFRLSGLSDVKTDVVKEAAGLRQEPESYQNNILKKCKHYIINNYEYLHMDPGHVYVVLTGISPVSRVC